MPRPKSTSRSRRSAGSACFFTVRWTFVLACLLIPSLWLPGTSSAGGCARGAVMCTNNVKGTMRTCSATLQCAGASAWDFATTTDMYVTACTPSKTYISKTTTTITLKAFANTDSPTDRACGWAWVNPGRGRGGTVQITAADGLPVELMDFSVEDDDASAAGDEPDDEPSGQ